MGTFGKYGVMAGFVGPEIPGVTDGLVFYADAALTYTSGSTTWYDEINSNNGTLTNGPTYSTDGRGSIVYDGTNDYVSIPNSQIEPILEGLTSLTVSMWVYLDDVHPNGTSLFSWPIHNSSAVHPYQVIGFALRASDLAVRGCIGDGSTRVFSSYRSTNMNFNEWYQIGFVWDSPNWTNFLNGVMITGTSTNLNYTIGTPANNGDVYIGTYNTNNVYWHDGKIANVKIYNRALSPTEITQNYNALKSRFNL